MVSQLNRTAANAVLSGRVEEAIVGANRRLSRKGEVIKGMLHGQSIVMATPGKLRISAAHRTAICRLAISDFLSLLGYTANISFAKRSFVVILDGKTYATDGNEIEVKL